MDFDRRFVWCCSLRQKMFHTFQKYFYYYFFTAFIINWWSCLNVYNLYIEKVLFVSILLMFRILQRGEILLLKKKLFDYS